MIVAYRQAAAEAIAAAEIEERTVDEDITIAFEYPYLNGIMAIVKEENPSDRLPKVLKWIVNDPSYPQRRGRTFESAVIKGGKCLYSQIRILSKLLYYYNSKQKHICK